MNLNRRDSIRLGAALALSGVLPAVAQACRLFPQDSTDRYVAYQDGAEVGFQRIEFSRDGGRFLVASELEFRYRRHENRLSSFSHRAREVWRRGWLSGFDATTRHDEHEAEIKGRSERHGILMVTTSDYDVTLQVSGYVVPASLWHRDARLVNRLIDLVDGRVKLVSVYYAGKDVLPGKDGVTVASHYRVRGEIDRDTWYSENCQLLRTVMPIKGARPVTLELVRPGA
ncbi:MAG: DUF6134 family protein [Gammaproteobacteria bacterium]|nr:DUF6134 family protein [Gammaproteobacteria bacterium]